MKTLVTALFIFVVLTFFPQSAMAQGCSGSHGTHGIFCPQSGVNLLGASYNPVSENWNWYMGAKTVFFHPARYVWVGGVGLGVVFNQSERGRYIPVFTFVPLEIGGLAIETSIGRVWATSPAGERKKTRLIMLSWNWNF